MERLLNLGIKLFALGVTTPATVAVIDRLFSTYPPFIRTFIIVCGVGLVEVVFLANWLAVEQRRNDAPEFKLRPVVSTWVMYFALLFIGIAHGEGVAAVPLRLALGLAIAGATWDTLIYGWSRATARADKDIRSTAKVRRAARRSAETVAIAEIQSGQVLQLQAIAQRQRVEGERLSRQSSRELGKVRAEYAEVQPDAVQVERPGRPAPSPAAMPALSRPERLTMLRRMVDDRGQPDIARYRELTGVGKSTAYDDLKALQAVSSNGNGRH